MPDPRPKPEPRAEHAAPDDATRRAPSRRLPSGYGLYIAVGAAGILLVVGTVILLRDSDTGPTPSEKLTAALQLFDQAGSETDLRDAERIATRLKAQGYRRSDFPGACEYILGMQEFRRALESSSDIQFLNAIRFLRETESRALPIERRPEWCYALGTSLYEVGLTAEALPLLEEAFRIFPAQRPETARRLVEICLDLKTPESLDRGLKLTSELLEQPELTPAQRDTIYIQRAWLLTALGRNDDAKKALSLLSDGEIAADEARVVLAQIVMTEERYAEAKALLDALVAKYADLGHTAGRRAAYLSAQCAERLGQSEEALRVYEQLSAEQGTQEGLAATIRLADLHRAARRDEQALRAFRTALAAVRRPEDYRNRWLTLDALREAVEAAWKDWLQSGKYETALALSQAMSPALTEVKARTLAAKTAEEWAAHAQRNLETAPFSRREALQQEVMERWRTSGQAYAELAESLRTTAEYAEHLWTSAEHFRRGHDFENALDQITRFINTDSKKLLPPAFVRRGQILMDLDRHAEALDHFQRVLFNYPTDPAVFEAQFLIGACYLEQNEPRKAEEVWSGMLASEALHPAAREWQRALFALSRLYFDVADGAASIAGGTATTDAPPANEEFASKWEAAARRLEEFVKRYPDSDDAAEARYLLAKSCRRRAEIARARLESADTPNAREESRREMTSLLEQAGAEFHRLQDELLALAARDALDPLKARLLQNTAYEIAHTAFALEDYEAAAAAYAAAANSNPGDPQALVAYVQLMNCYDRLHRPAEARGMLEQAKVLLQQLPDDAFAGRSPRTAFSRQEWENWLTQAGQLRMNPPTSQVARN